MTPSFSTVQGRGGRRSRVQRARAVRFPAGANVAQAFGHDAQAWAKYQCQSTGVSNSEPEKSFCSICKFLSFAIRQPRHLVDYRRHFAFIILNECQLRGIDFDEEICFRFGINIQRTW